MDITLSDLDSTAARRRFWDEFVKGLAGPSNLEDDRLVASQGLGTPSPLRYVILSHSEVSEPHYDLMFETLPGSMLATWRAEQWPLEFPTPITRLRDHRRLYLEYEGELSEQRGTVCRIAEGNCQVEVGENAVWTIRLLSGVAPQTLVLRRIDSERWVAEPARGQ